MNVQLDKRIEAIIARKVEAGEFNDAADVINAAILLLNERDEKLCELKAALQIGIDQLDRGEGIEWTPDTMDRIFAEAMVRFDRGERVARDEPY